MTAGRDGSVRSASQWGRCGALAAGTALMMALAAPAAAQTQSLTASLDLVLHGAAPREEPEADRNCAGGRFWWDGYFDTEWRDNLRLDLRCVADTLEALVSGYAKAFSLGMHYGSIVEQRVTSEAIHFVANMAINGHKGIGGGEAGYTVDAQVSGTSVVGTYTGTFKGKPVSGTVRGTIADLWPKPVAEFVPVAPGEHPRLLFRSSDIPALRAKAKTPEGQKMVARIRELLPLANDNKFSWGSGVYQTFAPPYCEGAWAMGHAFMWVLEQKPADLQRAKELAELAMRTRGGESGGWGNQHRNMGAAFAYDMIYNDCDTAFRRTMAGLLKGIIWGEGGMDVFNGRTCAFNTTGGIAGLAMAGDPEDDDGRAAAAAWRCEHFAKWYAKEAMGPGFMNELENQMDVIHSLLPFAYANRVSRGRDIATGTNLSKVIPFAMHTEGGFYWNDWGGSYWRTLGFAGLVPDGFRPALRDFMDISQRRDSQGEYVNDYGASNLPSQGVFALISYPNDVAARPIDEMGLPTTFHDNGQIGGHIYRSGWDRDDFIVAIMTQKDAPHTSISAGQVNVLGLGTGYFGYTGTGGGTFYVLNQRWPNHPCIAMVDTALPVGGARTTYSSSASDGSGIVSMERNSFIRGESWLWKIDGYPNAYSQRNKLCGNTDLGIVALRSVAADYSGTSGAPCLFAIVDRFEGVDPSDVTVALHFKFRGNLAIDGVNFNISRFGRNNVVPIKGVAVSKGGTLVARTDYHYTEVFADIQGSSECFVVATIQPDGVAHPAFTVTGEGLDARIGVGDQEVSFDGRKIVLKHFDQTTSGARAPHRTPASRHPTMLRVYDLSGRLVRTVPTPGNTRMTGKQGMSTGVYIHATTSGGLGPRRSVVLRPR